LSFTLGSQQMFASDVPLHQCRPEVTYCTSRWRRQLWSAQNLTIPQANTVSAHRCHVHDFDTPSYEDSFNFCNILDLG